MKNAELYQHGKCFIQLHSSESHILEDVKTCVRAINEGDPETLDRIAGAIRGRSTRVCHVVASEMDNYEPCMYTDRVLEAVKVLRDQGGDVAPISTTTFIHLLRK